MMLMMIIIIKKRMAEMFPTINVGVNIRVSFKIKLKFWIRVKNKEIVIVRSELLVRA